MLQGPCCPPAPSRKVLAWIPPCHAFLTIADKTMAPHLTPLAPLPWFSAAIPPATVPQHPKPLVGLCHPLSPSAPPSTPWPKPHIWVTPPFELIQGYLTWFSSHFDLPTHQLASLDLGLACLLVDPYLLDLHCPAQPLHLPHQSRSSPLNTTLPKDLPWQMPLPFLLSTYFPSSWLLPQHIPSLGPGLPH